MFDLIAFVGYGVFVATRHVIYIKLIFYFKIVPLISLDRQIEQRIEQHPFRCSVYQFARLIVDIVLVTNITGCIFFTIDYQLYLDRGFDY